MCIALSREARPHVLRSIRYEAGASPYFTAANPRPGGRPMLIAAHGDRHACAGCATQVARPQVLRTSGASPPPCERIITNNGKIHRLRSFSAPSHRRSICRGKRNAEGRYRPGKQMGGIRTPQQKNQTINSQAPGHFPVVAKLTRESGNRAALMHMNPGLMCLGSAHPTEMPMTQQQ